MVEYKAFVEKLEVGLKSFLSNPKASWKEQALKYVNGYAEDELRSLVNLNTRRQYGAFFTNHELAIKVLKSTNFRFKKDVSFYDPCCGAGNLLLAVSDIFGKKIQENGFVKKVYGTDLHQEFVDAAKLRLSINTLLNDIPLINYDLNIVKADGLVDNKYYKEATHIVTNPPFNLIESEINNEWASGKVSAAAIFIDRIIEHVNVGTSIIAILPDVLRSGTRYEKWRKIVDKKCYVKKINLLGQFDKYADVDVFSLLLVKREKEKKKLSNKSWITSLDTDTILGDLFDVCVGPVVDNRDPKIGANLPYIISRGLEGWATITQTLMQRQHEGKSFNSPFVVIKRTSRMGDAHRAIATLINIETPVFVDNHLIVIQPKSGTIEDCNYILERLRQQQIDEWINDQIRCRHLTVKVVSKIPL